MSINSAVPGNRNGFFHSRKGEDAFFFDARTKKKAAAKKKSYSGQLFKGKSKQKAHALLLKICCKVNLMKISCH
jgi:hypothetical protein